MGRAGVGLQDKGDKTGCTVRSVMRREAIRCRCDFESPISLCYAACLATKSGGVCSTMCGQAQHHCWTHNNLYHPCTLGYHLMLGRH